MPILSTLRTHSVKAFGVAVLATGAAVMAAGPASAVTTDWQVTSADSGTPGGIAQWEGPDTFRACDHQADGLRAWVQASYVLSGVTQYATLSDANGADTCTTGHTASLVKGVTVHLEVCLRDGAAGALQYCKTGSGKSW